MDKNAIKKYAVWARRELIERVAKKAQQYGIEENAEMDANADSINGKLVTPSEKKERQALISQIRDKGYEQVMEEVAYTWFNRFSALRFMEVNGYLPTHVRVFTDDENNFKPQILTEAIHLELDGLDMEKVYELKDADKTDELYKYLLITQCNALNAILPGMFQKIADYTELLLPDNLLREGSAIEQMITLIPEEDWKDAVQIIGWLYQYYNSEKKDEVFAALKKNVKITKENIPAATQLFTPDWIVRYMVENSLGRLWVEGHPNDELKDGWKYYLDEAEQEADVQAQLDKIREEYKTLKPEEIKCIDPCSGSGHILAYMFDVLMQIYEAYGYTSREAVASIVENNIYGLDIDERAAQLANFAVMMKARQYDRRFFSRKDDDGNLDIPQPNVYVICDSNSISKECLDYFANGNRILSQEINSIVDEMNDAKEYGSILNITSHNFNDLYLRFIEIENESVLSLYTLETLNDLLPVVKIAEILSQQYDAVVTNPPYMEISSGSKKLVDYVNENFIGGKTDMFAVFIERAAMFAKNDGFVGMITQPSITSLVSFEKIRRKLFTEKSFYSLAHMGRGIFGIDFGSVAFVYRNRHIPNYAARYFKLYERTFQFLQSEDIKRIYLNAINIENYKYDFEVYDTSIGINEESFETGNQISYVAKQDKFLLVPGIPFAYTMSEKMIDAYSNGLLGESFVTREGMATAGNDEFLRMWYEVNFQDICFNSNNSQVAIASEKKWFPYNKGGDYRKWYGNNDYVVDWENDGYRIKNNKDIKTGRIRSHNYNGEYAFKKGLTWSSISSGDISIRWSDEGFLFDSKGAKGFNSNTEELYSILGLLNSSVAMQYLKVISPTMDFKVGDIAQLPLNTKIFEDVELQTFVKNNVELLKKVWNFKETSWEYSAFPLLTGVNLENDIEAYISQISNYRNELKTNEEKINTIIARIYDLSDEVRCEVPDEKLSIPKMDNTTATKEFISFFVGCLFGRYSIDNLEFENKSIDFRADEDNIIPICDDEYFMDDIVGKFEEFLQVLYGKKNLDVNLRFVADVLGGKGHPKGVIRKYFCDNFFGDHCNMYSITGSGKRPIYWLFDSGKKGGFKALIYMHRYQQDTIARMRTDYVHEQQGRYRTEISDLETCIANASTSDRVKLNKQLVSLQDKSEEIRLYEEKIHHLADQMIRIDLDNGVKNNYAIFQDVLAKIK